jgi:hypothetical protein
VNVLIDWDSTTNQFDKHMRETLNEKYGHAWEHEHINSWDFYRDVLDPDQFEWIWGDEAFNSREWTLKIPPHDRAFEALELLKEKGFQPFIVSQREKHHAAWIEEWFAQYGYDYPVFVADKVINTKAMIARKYNLRIAVEDSPHGAAELVKTMTVYLIDTPWNQEATHPKLRRVASLYEAVDDMVYWYGN